mmetsp:Transcript_20992/g.45989  ORF Transcript_20992/g.45989 Transcript_20992/m.45989 type:complete len:285 (-) Transcript_20992:575-1429(-)
MLADPAAGCSEAPALLLSSWPLPAVAAGFATPPCLMLTSAPVPACCRPLEVVPGTTPLPAAAAAEDLPTPCPSCWDPGSWCAAAGVSHESTSIPGAARAMPPSTAAVPATAVPVPVSSSLLLAAAVTWIAASGDLAGAAADARFTCLAWVGSACCAVVGGLASALNSLPSRSSNRAATSEGLAVASLPTNAMTFLRLMVALARSAGVSSPGDLTMWPMPGLMGALLPLSRPQMTEMPITGPMRSEGSSISMGGVSGTSTGTTLRAIMPRIMAATPRTSVMFELF